MSPVATPWSMMSAFRRRQVQRGDRADELQRHHGQQWPSIGLQMGAEQPRQHDPRLCRPDDDPDQVEVTTPTGWCCGRRQDREQGQGHLQEPAVRPGAAQARGRPTFGQSDSESATCRSSAARPWRSPSSRSGASTGTPGGYELRARRRGRSGLQPAALLQCEQQGRRGHHESPPAASVNVVAGPAASPCWCRQTRQRGGGGGCHLPDSRAPGRSSRTEGSRRWCVLPPPCAAGHGAPPGAGAGPPVRRGAVGLPQQGRG